MSADTIRTFDDRLTPFARVALDAASSIGQPPRFHEGMTLEDAVIITGLPRDEAARRIREMKNDSDPDRYAALHLAESSGSEYTPAPAAPEAERQPAPKSQRAEVIKFPLFPEATRPVSNDMARGALFSCVQPNARLIFHKTKISTCGDAEIFWTGEQLTQDDHDVLMQLIQGARHYALGDYVTLSWCGLLNDLGRTTGGKQQKELATSVWRLMAGTIDYRSNEYNYGGHLVDDILEDKKRQHLVFRFNPSLKPFYDQAHYTLIDWEKRKKLRGKYLARWLQLELASHPVPFDRSVEYYKEKSGSTVATLSGFRKILRKALKELKDNGDILESSIDPKTDLVHVERTPSPAQLRHVTREVIGKPRKPRKSTP